MGKRRDVWTVEGGEGKENVPSDEKFHKKKRLKPPADEQRIILGSGNGKTIVAEELRSACSAAKKKNAG